jgi:hypothetical protein
VAVATAAVGLVAVVMALRGGSPWTDRLRLGLTGLIGLQIVGGLFVLAQGARPAEGLHFLYGIAAVVLLPLTGTFASEAPPRPRAWVLAGACVLMLLLSWRLASTG